MDTQTRQAYQRQYLMDHSNERKEYFRNYYKNNRIELIEKAKVRYQSRKEAFKANQRVYRQKNRLALNIAKKQGITITQAREQLKGG